MAARVSYWTRDDLEIPARSLTAEEARLFELELVRREGGSVINPKQVVWHFGHVTPEPRSI
jgi:hypothetical protein